MGQGLCYTAAHSFSVVRPSRGASTASPRYSSNTGARSASLLVSAGAGRGPGDIAEQHTSTAHPHQGNQPTTRTTNQRWWGGTWNTYLPLPEASTRCQLNHLLTCKVRREGVHRLVTADDFHVILTTWDRQLGRFLGLHKRTRSGNRVGSGAVPNSPILSLSQPYPVLRGTLCSCKAYGMRPICFLKKNRSFIPEAAHGDFGGV